MSSSKFEGEAVGVGIFLILFDGKIATPDLETSPLYCFSKSSEDISSVSCSSKFSSGSFLNRKTALFLNSSTSTLLNVDTISLANQPQGDFFGYIQTGMILKGTSGAEAKVTNVRLVTDFTSTVQGSFYIPNPNVNTNPVFQTGERDFLLTDDPENDPSESTTTGKDIYTASGSVQTVQENIVSVRNAKIQNLFEKQDRAVSEQIGTELETEVNQTPLSSLRLREVSSPK